MIFWIVAALLAGGLGFALARPLLRGAAAPPPSRAEYDMTVYRDQLAEIERDRARGVLSDDQAAAARTEVERRLLAAGEARGAAPPAARSGTAPLIAAGLAVAVPALAIALYVQLGRPGLPGQPLAERRDLRSAPSAQTADPHPGGAGGTESMQALTERLAKRMEANPGDPEGWSLLARSYQQLERHREAAVALERAVGLTKREPGLLSALAEARIMAADGTVPEQARAELEEVLKSDPKDPRARFYIAMAEGQAGRLQQSLDRLVALAKDTPADAPFLPMVRDRIAGLARELKQDAATVLAALPQPQAPAPAPPQTQAAPSGAERGPGPADMAAAAQMSPEQRQQMIRGMVDGLAQRMEQQPNDVDGWLRLIRAYKVMGEDAKAADAAAKALSANPAARPQIAATAQQLGVTVAAAPPAAAPATSQPRPLDAAAIRAGTPAGDLGALRRRLDGNPNDREALFQLGLAEAAVGNRIAAAEFWGRLLGQFDPASPEYGALRERLDALKRGG
ncbi:MAG: c-type cytochrome biogenesis protein CcmI [Alphaproteobacteria bacterium]|nr:c-type cytochrome biogenesis protein CcmI [Alphaproteobacteria bacterium]